MLSFEDPSMTTVMVAPLLNISWAKQEGYVFATSPSAPAGRAAGISRKRCAHNPKPASLAIRLASEDTQSASLLIRPGDVGEWDPARGPTLLACH